MNITPKPTEHERLTEIAKEMVITAQRMFVVKDKLEAAGEADDLLAFANELNQCGVTLSFLGQSVRQVQTERRR